VEAGRAVAAAQRAHAEHTPRPARRRPRPITPGTAQRIADATGASLSATRMVDEIYAAADSQLPPRPLPPGDEMTTNAYYGRHQAAVAQQRARAGLPEGALLAGHKKDVVLSERLARRPDRVAIYGWHRPSGEPIQPLSTVHGADYADYSHGVRLVADQVRIDGQWRALDDVLRDPSVAGLLSAEGAMSVTRVP
jgi:hypothetical protein